MLGLWTQPRPADRSGAYDAMRVLNRRYHQRFPRDAARLQELLDRCAVGDIRTLDGAPVSARLVRTIGHHLGMDGGAEDVHQLLELDFASPAFRHDVAAMLPFGARNPIYAVLHESSYADGGATRWSADRVQPGDFRGDSPLLTAEHLEDAQANGLVKIDDHANVSWPAGAAQPKRRVAARPARLPAIARPARP